MKKILLSVLLVFLFISKVNAQPETKVIPTFTTLNRMVQGQFQVIGLAQRPVDSHTIVVQFPDGAPASVLLTITGSQTGSVTPSCTECTVAITTFNTTTGGTITFTGNYTHIKIVVTILTSTRTVFGTYTGNLASSASIGAVTVTSGSIAISNVPHVIVDSGASGGTLSNNNAAPGANNTGVLPSIANAAAPTYTEGRQVLDSVDLSGNKRTIVTNLTTDSADNAPFTENPVGVGCKYIVTPAAHTDGDKAVCLTDILGNIGILPIPAGATTYSCVLNAGTAVTGTSDTICGALVSSQYLYLTSCSVSNDHASTSTLMVFKDGSGGTVKWKGLVPFGSGREITFPTPMKTGNGVALYMANITNSSSTYASCNGYSSPVSY